MFAIPVLLLCKLTMMYFPRADPFCFQMITRIICGFYARSTKCQIVWVWSGLSRALLIIRRLADDGMFVYFRWWCAQDIFWSQACQMFGTGDFQFEKRYFCLKCFYLELYEVQKWTRPAHILFLASVLCCVMYQMVLLALLSDSSKQCSSQRSEIWRITTSYQALSCAYLFCRNNFKTPIVFFQTEKQRKDLTTVWSCGTQRMSFLWADFSSCRMFSTCQMLLSGCCCLPFHNPIFCKQSCSCWPG